MVLLHIPYGHDPHTTISNEETFHILVAFVSVFVSDLEKFEEMFPLYY